MESTMADYDLAGVVRERSGSVLAGVAPSNVYPTADGAEILIAANADTVFARLAAVMNRSELASDPRYATHVARGERMTELDELITSWTRTRPSDDLLAELKAAGVPADRIYTAADMLTDQHYAARGQVVRAASYQGWEVPMAGVVPRFSRTPGAVRATGPRLGADTKEVLSSLADLGPAEVDALARDGVISCG
jgi:crotonobetainyl-CoA:carnitine CoA-transferase CaiB-like acyl-CoA transferase